MYSMLILFYMFITFFLTNLFSIVYAVPYSDTNDYDGYGTRIASTNHFVILARNDVLRYSISMGPYGMGKGYICDYSYRAPNDFVINVAVSRRQNVSQLSFVYLRTSLPNG